MPSIWYDEINISFNSLGLLFFLRILTKNIRFINDSKWKRFWISEQIDYIEQLAKNCICCDDFELQ